MVDPNITLFHKAQNVTITGGEIVVAGRDYIKNIYVNPNTSTLDQIPLLPALRPPSVLFTGRDIYLQALKDCFSPKRVNGRKLLLLYGMGGIGKTQICLKFIEEYGKKWFSDIFWIDASSEHTIDLCLRQIAQKHKVDSTPSAESTLEWISGRNDWLMVFDNADGGYQVVEKFVPYGNEGSILVTSRDKALERVTSPTHSLEVIEMGEEEAITLLLKSAAVDNNTGEDVAIAAQKLVTLLGCIPLAIDQAGAYMQSCGCGVVYYLELFIKHRTKLMSDKEFRGASLYSYSTYGTWEISIEEIKCRAEGKNTVQRLSAESALILHNIFAFLHHDNISGEIFEKAAVNFMKRKGEETNGLPQSTSWLDSKTLFLNEEGNWDGLKFLAGIKVLLSFSLIRNNEMLYFVHPLIQTWSRDRIPVANISDCCQKSRSLLACSLNLSHQEDNHRFCALLAPHVEANDEHAAQWISDDQYYDDQNERFALVFDRVGNWGQTEKLLNGIMSKRVTRLGPLHAETLTAMDHLASTYRNQGKWKEAEGLEVQVIEGRKEILGPLNEDTLMAMGNLASTYINQGKWKEAETLDVHVMEAMKEKLGLLHHSTLTAMSNLAVAYWKQGKWTEAESLEVQVMEASKEKLGPLHPDTLTAMGNLALTYTNQGKWKEAESIEVQVMEASKEKLGPLHPDTLTTMGNLASTYRQQGKWKEAESIEVQVMEASKEKLGPLHPDTLTAMGNLALTYRKQGQWKEAESIQVQVMEASKEKLGPLHPDTLTAMGNLALTYRKQGQWKEAENLQVQVMEARKEKFGPLHPDTLIAMGNLASTYTDQGQWKEAESLQVHVLEARKEKFEPLHPSTLIAMGNLAFTYRNQGKWEEAESLEVQVLKARKEKFGPLHPDTLTAMANLAITYRNQGKWTEAESLEVQVMEARKEKLGPFHPDTLTAMANLASTCRNEGKWKEAESIEVHVMEAMKEKLGPLHPDTLSAMANLALTYREQNKSKEAKELLDASIKGMQEILGAEHPTTIQYIQVLADIAQHAKKKTSRKMIKDVRNKFGNKIRSIMSKIKAKTQGDETCCRSLPGS